MASKRDLEGLGAASHQPFRKALEHLSGPRAEDPQENPKVAPAAQIPDGGGPVLGLRRERAGRAGHEVTIVAGLDPSRDADLARRLAKELGCRVAWKDASLVVGLGDAAKLAAYFERHGRECRRSN